MNIIFTIVAAPLMGWFIKSRTGAVAIFLAGQSVLFVFQSLTVLLAWMAGEGGFGGATEQGAFGPAPSSFPVRYEESDLWAYGLLNLALILLGVAIVIGAGRLRVRRAAKSGTSMPG